MNDVRVVQRRCGACFLLETTQTFTILDETSREEFQRYLAMELSIFSQINRSHSTFAEQSHDPVMSNILSCFEFNAINQHLSRSLIGRHIHKITRIFMRLQQ